MSRMNFFVEFAIVLGFVGGIGTWLTLAVQREKGQAEAPAPLPARAPLPVMRFQPLQVEYGPGNTRQISEAAIITAPDGQCFLYTRYIDAIQVSPILTNNTKATP